MIVFIDDACTNVEIVYFQELICMRYRNCCDFVAFLKKTDSRKGGKGFQVRGKCPTFAARITNRKRSLLSISLFAGRPLDWVWLSPTKRI